MYMVCIDVLYSTDLGNIIRVHFLVCGVLKSYTRLYKVNIFVYVHDNNSKARIRFPNSFKRTHVGTSYIYILYLTMTISVENHI